MRVTKNVDGTRQAVDALRVRTTSFRDLGPSTILQRAHASNCSSTVRTQHGHRREQVSPESAFTSRGCGSDYERRARRHGNKMEAVTVPERRRIRASIFSPTLFDRPNFHNPCKHVRERMRADGALRREVAGHTL